MNNKELYHSDIYLGEEYSDGIKHYKYLKKVKTSSGKWRYIYDETELKNAKNKMKELERARKKLEDKKGYVSYIDKYGDYVKRNVNEGTTITTSGSYNNTQSKKDIEKEKILEKEEKVTKNYYTQKFKDIPKRVISKGLSYIHDLLYGPTEKGRTTFQDKWVR